MRGLARGNKWGGNPDADLPGEDAPVDVAAVRRDDALIDAIAGGGPVATDSPEQYELALLLANWREDIVSTPMPTGPLLDDVVAAMEASDSRAATRSAGRERLRLLRPIAGAAAAIAVVMGGATIFSYNAEPGDPLWSVKSVVFSQQADSTVAKIDTASQLQEAERLISVGDVASAKHMLDTAAQRAGEVREADQRNELEVWNQKLAAELEKLAPLSPATTAPGTTTTSASAPTTSVPPSGSVTPNTTTPGVPPLPGTVPPSDLQIPGLPPLPLPQLPQLPTDLQGIPGTPPSPTTGPTIMSVPEQPSDISSTMPSTQSYTPVPPTTTTAAPIPLPPTS
ncbi:MAG: anti-sigma-D factor RsdA [Rhodococcus sp. (in: high G+C Gram-positive bacteria)]|uniref:anti-sigma-D factor RsdA n=1 Tax=Rhodococcus sp. TaxID=1831 RepID=UPI003BB013CE